jgi:methylated-DNA-[protein]-cysteine S-methyltransferase
MRTEERLFYTTFATDYGWIGALASPRGLVKIVFLQKTRELAHSLITCGETMPDYSIDMFKDLKYFFIEYFAGRKVSYKGKIDLLKATIFQRSVWDATRTIPYGTTLNYAGIARVIKRPLASRAVGNALNKNPLPIVVPCHRVIACGEKLGGFNGGLDVKIMLLKLENSY